MLDLSLLNQKTWDLKLLDGTVLNVRKPNNDLFKETQKMAEAAANKKTGDKITTVTYSFLTKVLNRNTNGRKFTQQEIEQIIPLDIAVILIYEYQKFVIEVMQGVNF